MPYPAHNEIIPPHHLQGKTIVDAGSGPGKLSFLLAQFARTVYAVEPVNGFRRLIKRKTREKNLTNVYTVDGVLDSLPFPENSIDYLMTSQAVGWNFETELCEIERVLKPDGCAIHLFGNNAVDSEDVMRIHDVLTSTEWNYEYDRIKNTSGIKLRYHKAMGD